VRTRAELARKLASRRQAIIDIQISVASFEPLAAFKQPLERLGYVYRAANTERTRRLPRAARPSAHAHRRSPGRQLLRAVAVLFSRLPAHPPGGGRRVRGGEAAAGQEFRDERRGYTDAKAPFTWRVIRLADEWAQGRGWLPGPSDA
jgi:GrpB-like predicted nucleotidyltransferase (UPF0157 family)